MFILKKKDNKKIFPRNKKHPMPKLVKAETIVDESGKKEILYHYDIYINIDKRYAIEKDMQRIEINLSNEPLGKTNKREGIFDNINTKNPKEINLVAFNAHKIKLDKTANKRKIFGIKKLSDAGSDNIFDSKNISKLKSSLLSNKTEHEIFGTKKRLKLFPKLTTTSTSKKNLQKNLMLLPKNKISNKKIDKTKKFQTKYSKLINSGKDPAARLTKIIKDNRYQGINNKYKGRFLNLNKTTKDGVFGYLGETIKEINQTHSGFKNSEKFELFLTEVSGRNGVLTQRLVISNSQLISNASNKIYLILTALDKKGISIEVDEIIVNHREEKEKLDHPKFDFEIEANRTSTGQSILKIINNENIEGIFNVYTRQLNEYTSSKNINFSLKLAGVKIPPKSSKILFRKGNHFKRNRPVFFRVNPVYDQSEYSNTKFASIESGRKLNVVNYASLSAIIQPDRMAIQIKNVSEGIRKIELYRRNLTKKERNFSPTKSYSLEGGKNLIKNRGKIINQINFNGIFTFYDNDVEYDHTYEYKALLYDDNGNKSLSSNSAIENYSKPHGVINIIPKRKLIKADNNQKYINISGQIEKMTNDADNVFQDLFGRYYDLFENDLKEIKDLNAMTVNILIETINRDSSEISKVSDVKVDSEGNFNSNIVIPANKDIAIKLTPRILPPAEILSKINSNLPHLAAKNRFAPVSAFNTAAIKKTMQLTQKRQISAMAGKYSDRLNRTKGKLIDFKTQLNRTNYDAYYDGNTGDVRYILENSILDNSYDNMIIAVSDQDIKYLSLDNISPKNNNMKNNNIRKEYYLSIFTAIDEINSLDYFVMSYEENGNTVVDGLSFAFSNEDEININYIYQTPVLYGKIDFYAQPILKNGKMQNPILIKTIYKDDEGIK